MEKDPPPERRKILSEKHYNDFEPGPIPLAPDGGIVPGYGSEPPPAQPPLEASLCRQGPCRHYWHMVSEFPAGNPDSIWKELKDPLTGKPLEKPKQHWHSCLVQLGMETDIGEETIFTCNRWDPINPDTDPEWKNREERRRAYAERAALDTKETP